MYTKFLFSLGKKITLFGAQLVLRMNKAFPPESNVSLFMLCLVSGGKRFLGIFSDYFLLNKTQKDYESQ